MAAAPETDLRTGDSAAAGLQESRATAVKQQSMYKTPDDYFFHTKTHIDEGDIVIVFMVSSYCIPYLACRRSERAFFLPRQESRFRPSL
jgi:hypothetical protein